MSNYKRIYLENYSYYLTVVTQNRKPILIDNIELLRDSFRRSKRKYCNYFKEDDFNKQPLSKMTKDLFMQIKEDEE